MPAYNPYTTYIPSATMQHPQSTMGECQTLFCENAAQQDRSAASMNSSFVGSTGSSATSYTPYVSPMYTPGRQSLSGNPPFLHPQACIPLPPLSRDGTLINPLLERGTTPPITYDIRTPPSFATSRCHLVEDDRWRFERTLNPDPGSLTIRTALVSKPVVVFPACIDDGVITVQDVLLAVHYALHSSALDDQHHRRQHQQGELLNNRALKSHRPHEDCTAFDVASGCFRWAGLMQSQTENDVWILTTT
ncbi:hypothetical protein K443DRAFT_363464 [Laccaria amethystina LaAM-08-1]|uniref:DUF6699 domain-containing protein n=1 Tax=Laccaria amethystina LaAM-08-1 TaxID=1095629 RepID=A0A0C9WZB1_9AGAR|nr:hypothetical protein K443DRAFT_113210 [Laccaria amethystina LaAM-08-1]KIJ94313.1 hypothetical protein K443DRAFT_363464 [Laccaria amethystina LaAM-08-1]